MDIKDIRLAALEELLQEEGQKKVDLARRIKKSPTQISQWLSGFRTISEQSAREIELAAKKLPLWMDQQRDAGSSRPAAISAATFTLEQALEVLGMALAVDMPDEVRDDLADALAKLARRRGADRDQQQVLGLLQAPPDKQRLAG